MVSKNPQTNFQQIVLFINYKLTEGHRQVNLTPFKEVLKNVLLKDLKAYLNTNSYKGDLKVINGTLYFVYKGNYS